MAGLPGEVVWGEGQWRMADGTTGSGGHFNKHRTMNIELRTSNEGPGASARGEWRMEDGRWPVRVAKKC